ncbi:hypothetical protein [Kitasatospora sp. NPDC056184]|uniref:hypothetical protein n=1 Tax=Kitasatospora sp. NPDC056184 TaxID=3345738 RepID=UPI0035D8410B
MSVSVAAAVLAGGLTVALAPSASAAGAVYTGTSSKGGYGIAEISATRYFYACDLGSADGLRVVAHLWPDGHSYQWVQDANGSNGSCGSGIQLSLPIGTGYTLRVCLRDGADGIDQLCRQERGTILT